MAIKSIGPEELETMEQRYRATFINSLSHRFSHKKKNAALPLLNTFCQIVLFK